MTSLESTQEATNTKLKQIVEKEADLGKRKKLQDVMDGFEELFGRFIKEKSMIIDWEKIKPPPEEMVVEYKNLPKPPKTPSSRSELASKLVVLKLNGGLGTTMGCTGPKSVIEVHSEQTFLDLTVQQLENLNKKYNTDIPMVLMNSFNTDTETKKVIHKYRHSRARVYSFMQSQFPRIYKESLLPVPESPSDEKEAWYPPGHGDVFRSLANSDILEQLLKEGRKYVFISNVDNLGATVDFRILQYLIDSGTEYAMEVTNKTKSDVKGGTLIEYEGKAKLLEIAQCPPSKVDEFKSIKKFKIFNTNNLWVSLEALHRVLTEKTFQLDIIVNNKKLSNGSSVIQLETAAGAAIQFFKNGKGINVNRQRFLPVKSCSDLLIVQSNLYTLKQGKLILNPQRPFPSLPWVKLGDHFNKVSDYQKRLGSIPNILELDQLTVSGDVVFGSGVVLKGSVIIVANHGSHIDIPSGSVLENKIVSGNLRILEH